MYLHHLELRAIGPYPDLVTIDFATLAASGVFLLEGPTGSGKSTIIDAVVFALYGKLAGADVSDDRLHSQHADPAVEPYVELVFETGAGVFRVRRTPQYDRPKQRGTGTVRQQSSARLFRLAGADDRVGEPVSDRAQEVGAEITRIVGLDRAQFLQTVVLPQGEFARFLKSPGEERRKLLQSLFGTEVHDRTAAELADRRRAAAAQVDAADARVHDALGRFRQAAGDDDADESGADDLVAELTERARAAGDVRGVADSAVQAARAAVAAAERRTGVLRRRADLVTRLAALDARADEIDDAHGRLDAADRAARVTGVLDGLGAAAARAASRRGVLDALREQHAEHLATLADGVDAGAAAAALRAAADAVRHLVPVGAALVGRLDRIRTLEHERAAAASRLDAVAADLERHPAERAAIVERARAAADRAADAEPAQRELDAVAALRSTLADRARADVAVLACETEVTATASLALAALAHENDLRTRRITDLAGELGAALADGAPCPVCGATEHPHVATTRTDHPTPEQIEAAADARAESEAELSGARSRAAVARQEADRLAALVGDTDAAGLDLRRTTAQQRLDDARAAARQVAAAEQERAGHDDRTRDAERERTEIAARLAGMVATTTAEQDRLDADVRAVDDALAAVRSGAAGLDVPGPDPAGPDDPDGGVPDAGVAGPERVRAALSARGRHLAEAVRLVDARGAALTEVAAAAERLAVAERDTADRRAEADAALVAQRFADADAVRAAALPERDATALRRTVTTVEHERAVLDAGFADPDVVAAEHDTDGAVDLDGARAALATTTAEHEQASALAVSAADRAAAAGQCATDLARAVTARDATSAAIRAVVRLADVTNGVPGANPTGITLGTYVLMRRFEDVVAAANDRLRAMLGGRFSLETSDERESGQRARRTGLALAVRDHTTDTTRDPRSLSGGETFTFSLCLALGLADVVQAEAGGVSLGTLFVDEGFGTLDPETLDDVIGQLSRLTAGGRQVGIVSHVEELKQRIPERIAVRRTASGGSRVTTTV